MIFSFKLLNDKYRCPSGWFPLFVNKVSSLTIVNETTNDRFENDRFFKTISIKKQSFLETIVSFYVFRRRFYNKTIVFFKNENDSSLVMKSCQLPAKTNPNKLNTLRLLVFFIY